MNDANLSLLSGNRLLAALPPEEQAFLRPSLSRAAFQPGVVLAQTGDVLDKCYFPTKGMISLLSQTEDGSTVEVAFAGCEGMMGIAAVLGKKKMPYQALVQAPTECFVTDAGTVIELFGQGGVFHDLLLRYVHALIKQISQTCVCNHYHTIEARLCRWLTVMSERSEDKHLSLTQEFLAHMLGVQRTSIGLIANSMQRTGIIRYRRGKIEVTDLDRLRASACECYFIVAKEFKTLFDSNNVPHMSDTMQTKAWRPT